MSIMVGDNFSYKGSKPLDARTKFATVAEMVATPVADLYDGCEAYVTATKKYYSYDSTNEVDETLGKWRERQSGGSETTDYSDLDNKPQIEGVTLSGNKSASDLGLAKLTDLTDFITKTVDDLVNYYTKSQTYSKTEVDTIASNIKNSRFEAVATLPTSDIKTNVIYLVPKADAEIGDIKDEYINLDGTTAGWERIGSTEIDLSNYVSEDDLNTALADYTTTTDLTALLANKQDRLQYSILPTASAELEGKIFEYTGATGNGLTHGYFYECVSDGENPATYSWQQTNVQPNSGGGGSYTAGDGIDITNDVISTKQSESGDIDEIVDVYPQAGNLVSIVNAFNKGDIYSTEEKMIGQWIDGRPLYQRVVDCGVLSNSIDITIPVSGSSTMDVVDIRGFAESNGAVMPIPFVHDKSVDSMIAIKFNQSTGINIYSRNNTGIAGYHAYVILKYTKTTDVAISIGEATEYSTDEKVVGTWIDGKPLWQKTFATNITISSASGWFGDVDVSDCNIDEIKSSFASGIYNNQKVSMYPVVRIDNGTLSFSINDMANVVINQITIQYTKTTT